MTPLRKQMNDYMSSKNFSKSDIDSYIKCIVELAQFYNKSPDKLSNDEVQNYLLSLQNHKNLSRTDCDAATLAIFFSIMSFLKANHLELSHQINKNRLQVLNLYVTVMILILFIPK